MDQKTTQELLEVLNRVDSDPQLETYLDTLSEERYVRPFNEYFTSLPEVQALKRTELLQRSGIERTYFYQLMRGERRPGRNKAIALCLAAELSLPAVQRVLEICEHGILYSKNRRDAILIFCVNRTLPVTDADELLDRFGEKTLSESD